MSSVPFEPPSAADAPYRSAIDALRQSESRYRRLFEAAKDGILLLNVETGQIEDVNPYLINMLGYTHAEFLGKKLWDVGSFADIAQSKDLFERLKEHGYVRYEDLPLKARSGAIIAVEFVSNVYECAGIKVIQCNIRNLTEIRKHQAEIKETRDRLKAIIDASIDAILVVDEEERVLVFSAAAETMFELPAAEALGKSLERFIPQRFRSGHREHIKQFLDSSVKRRAKGKLRRLSALRRDGSEFPIEASISHVPGSGGHLLTVTIRDMTEVEQAEAGRALLEMQLRESQKMQAIGTLAGGIAHDFNNIIATILGNTDLASEDVRSNPRALESLDEIRKAGRRARDLVQQIVAFSRRQPTDRKLVSLVPLIEESVRLLRATLPARFTMDVHCSPDVPPVLADATQIQQVLINLATNAMQAMQSNPGHIGIHLDMVDLDEALADARPELQALYEQHPGKTVRLAVSDDGSGMDAATRNRIFEPFFTTKPVGEGTGLGLSVVHGIALGHEGAITVDSDPGRGTTIALYLRVGRQPAGTAQPDTVPAAAAAEAKLGQHILYVDDEESLVFLVKRVLERRGYRVSAFTSQRLALQALRADPGDFSLVVTDYNMPGMSGLDVTHAVHAVRPDLPVAIVSGFVDEALRTQADGAGVREVISKTTDLNAFCMVVQRLAQSVEVDTKVP